MSYNHPSVTEADLQNFVIIHPGLLERLLHPRHCRSCNCDSKRKQRLIAGPTLEHSGSTSQGEQESCKWSSQLKTHKKTHCESASPECESDFSKTRDIEEAPSRPNGTSSPGQYTKSSCRICDRTFSNNGELEAHYAESHKQPVVRLRRLVITTM
ncbi:unnamed protein product [Allacma fusca]|uniref:C2H2-type domain-containing protein n=1 Tax=Allacma fusca TaxID=39272 RepID=A0A8J2JAB7_9HEXA|nr:unnamed protein product [Allacma fusca]